jgi:hypothetical protein
MVAKQVFVNCYRINTFTYIKKVNFNVSYKTLWSWGRSRNSDLRLREVGAERNIFGSATLV